MKMRAFTMNCGRVVNLAWYRRWALAYSLYVCVAGLGCLAANALTLENDALAISFASAGSGFAVTSVVNRLGGGVRFVETDLKEPDFWAITLVPDG